MKNLILMLFLFSSFIVWAQNEPSDKEIRDKASDALKELDEGKLTLRFVDALTGKPIKNGEVTLAAKSIGKTDFEGRVYFEPEDSDKAYLVSFKHPDYIETDFEVEVMAGTIFANKYSISPRMPLGYLRVVLDWGKEPRDLDAHLIKVGSYHISFRDMHASADGIAKLDRDDTDGEGPETITVSNVDDNAEYLFYVHDYSNSGSTSSDKLSKSSASVKVYSNNLLKENFKVIPNTQGTKWNVFRIQQGRIMPVNQVSN